MAQRALLVQPLDSVASVPVLPGMGHPFRIAATLVILGFVWGGTPSLAKLAMAEGMAPLGVACWTAAISAAALLAVCAARGEMPGFTRAHWRHYLVGGFIGLSLANYFSFTGLSRAPAGLFALLLPLSGLLTTLFFAMAGREKATPRIILGTVFCTAGVMLAMAPGAAMPDAALLPWAALMVLTPICYAASNLLSVTLAVPGSKPLAQAAGTLLGAAVTVPLLAAPLGQLMLPPSGWVALVLLAQGVLTAAAYLVYFRLLTGSGGMVTSQVSYLTTLAGLLYGYLLFNEQPGWLTVPATLLIFGGVALVTLSGRAAVSPRRP